MAVDISKGVSMEALLEAAKKVNENKPTVVGAPVGNPPIVAAPVVPVAETPLTPPVNGAEVVKTSNVPNVSAVDTAKTTLEDSEIGKPEEVFFLDEKDKPVAAQAEDRKVYGEGKYLYKIQHEVSPVKLCRGNSSREAMKTYMKESGINYTARPFGIERIE